MTDLTRRWRSATFRWKAGGIIENCTLSYVVHGLINDERSNVVLGLSAIGSNHHRLDFLIGPGRALDPAQWAVVCVDALGNGMSSSPSISREQPGLAFPRFSIRDMVNSQSRLMQYLSVERLHAVVGASMGGMQALQWAVSYPSAMTKVVAMTPMAKTAPWAAAINAAARAALMADPQWAQLDHYSAGVEAWIALMQVISGRTPASVDALQNWLTNRLRWQRGQGTHPIDWIYQSYAYDAHDVGDTKDFGGDTAAALSSTQADTLVMAPPLDLYNPSTSAQWAARRVPGAKFVNIPSQHGHRCASAVQPQDAAFINQTIRTFLDTP